MEEKDKEQENKKLLEALEKVLESETVEKITLTIKPDKNQKQK